MLTIFALLLAGAAPAAGALADAPAASTSADQAGPHGWKCSTGRNRLREQESRESWDQIKAFEKKHGRAGGGMPPEAQKILDQMTEFYEQDDSRSSSDMAEMMREFAGGKAERRTAC